MSTRVLDPDPLLTASVYADHALDRVVHEVAGATVDALRLRHSTDTWGLWWVRYSRNGDHLKIRLHGPTAKVNEAQRLLEEKAHVLFQKISPSAGASRINNPRLPPIDRQDNVERIYEDCTLLWTDYERSPISFGARDLLDDDEFVGAMTACLAAGGDLVRQVAPLGEDGRMASNQRQRAVLSAAIAALAAAPLTPPERTAYLNYHRGWLIRFAVSDESREAALLAGFDRQADRMIAGLERTGWEARARWNAQDGGDEDGPEGAWIQSIRAMSTYAAPFRHDASRRSDPFAEDELFPFLFKALHGVANQAGFDQLNEAFAYHALLRSTATDPAIPMVAHA